MSEAVTVTHTDIKQAELYAKLKTLDVSMGKVKAAAMFQKVGLAELALDDMRNVLGAVVSSIHSLKNDIERLKEK